LWWHIFLFFFSHFFTFLPVTLNLAYFAPLKGVGRIFSVNFNYQRCLKNSNMMNFWLTSWVTWWWQIFFSFFHFLPRTRVSSKQPLIKARPKYYFDNSVTFLETRDKTDWYLAPLLIIEIFNKKKVVVWKKVSLFPDRFFAYFLAKNMLYQCSTKTVITFFLVFFAVIYS
jgi:hypothetical protein